MNQVFPPSFLVFISLYFLFTSTHSNPTGSFILVIPPFRCRNDSRADDTSSIETDSFMMVFFGCFYFILIPLPGEKGMHAIDGWSSSVSPIYVTTFAFGSALFWML